MVFSQAQINRSSNPQFRPLNHLLTELTHLCQQRCTGNLYFVSVDQHAGSFTLRAGEIIAMRYACRRGVIALQALREIAEAQRSHLQQAKAQMTQDPQRQAGQADPDAGWCSYRFMPKKVSASEDTSLPRTQTILQQLAISPSPRTSGPQVSPRASVPQVPVSQASTSRVSERGTRGPISPSIPVTRLSPRHQALILHHLTHYLGPASRLVAQKAFHQTQNPDQLLRLLATKIPDPREARQFQERVRSAIQL